MLHLLICFLSLRLFWFFVRFRDNLLLLFLIFERLFIFAIIVLNQIHILFEIQFSHRLDYVLSIDGFPLLRGRNLTRFTRDERNEFADTFLDALSCFFRYFGVRGQSWFHNSVNVCYGQKAVLIRLIQILVSHLCCCSSSDSQSLRVLVICSFNHISLIYFALINNCGGVGFKNLKKS